MPKLKANVIEIDTSTANDKRQLAKQSSRWKREVTSLVCQVRTLTLLLKHPRVPWSAKAVAGCGAAYLLSPIQFIPTFIPVIGQMDDLLVLFLTMKLVRKLTPAEIVAACEARSQTAIFVTKTESAQALRISKSQKIGGNTAILRVSP